VPGARRETLLGVIARLKGHSGLARNRTQGRAQEPPDPATIEIRSLLLASEGRPITADAVNFAARIAAGSGAWVHVLSVARVWGTSFGLPNPGLLPTKREWEQQRSIVANAIRQLKIQAIEASGQVLATRSAAKRIVAEAVSRQCDAIVMAADPPRHWVIENLLWSHEPHRVRRRARIPVYLV
jgi:nucleotide-binding universal stress UspA family protein